MNNNTHFEEKLRSAGLRTTKQRLKMCEILFDRKKTFHFTIDDLRKILKKKLDIKISQATIYNTINAFKNKDSGIVIGRSLTNGNIKNNTKNLLDHLNK